DELLDALWPNETVSESVLPTNAAAVRRALRGDPGIGKTFTATEAARRAIVRGAEVLTGRCYEGAGAPAFWPWLQILRQSLREGDAAALARALGPAAGDLADLLPELPAPVDPFDIDTASAPEQARFRLVDGITRYFEARSRQRPLVLILEDLHWADKASLLLLQFLNRELPHLHILVVGSYRDVELRRDRALAGALGVLGREPHCARISLTGFERREVARFVQVRGHEDPDPAFLEAVLEMTAAAWRPQRGASRGLAMLARTGARPLRRPTPACTAQPQRRRPTRPCRCRHRVSLERDGGRAL
ncbi:MAG: AAA family ATPase, partial [Candidatus Poseidoniia archaeon]